MFKGRIAALTTLAVLGILGFALADKWQPYQFGENETYEYKVTSHDGDEKTEGFFGISIKPTGEKDENDEDLVEVTYTTRGKLPKSQLGEQTAFGFWGAQGISLGFVAMNPAYSMFIQQMDLAVGEKMSLFGAGMVKCVKKETVGGREGFVCQLFTNTGEDGKEILAAEWTIDPELAMPIRSRTYDNGTLTAEMELVKYVAGK